MRRLSRALGALALAAVAATPTGCSLGSSAAVLSSDEILEELDEIVSVAGTQDRPRIVYAEEAMLSAWYMRFWLTAPVRHPFSWIFGRRVRVKFDEVAFQHGDHVRNLLRELPVEVGQDLWSCGAAMSRFGWLAELDSSALTRVVALDGMARICLQLGIDPFAGAFAEQEVPLAAEDEDAARQALLAHAPSQRQASTPVEQLEDYRIALQRIVARPLSGPIARLRLVEDLTARFDEEPRGEPRAWVAEALRTAMGHCTRRVLLAILQQRHPSLTEVRVCALEQVRRLGGARTVPLMLAIMSQRPLGANEDGRRFDPDELMMLRLIHYCGQLRGELARQVVVLPGRQEWDSTSAVMFLAGTVRKETEFYSSLRMPAIIALTWSLGRDRVDPDPQWVLEWLDENAVAAE